MSLSKSTYHSSKTIGNFLFSSEKTITKNTATKFLYEKENHLGNVHVVISDRKLPVDDGVYDSNGNQTSTTPDGIFDYYEPDVVFAADYYDGVGMVMPGRLFVTEDHRYGAQGSEVDQEIDGSRDRITTYYRQGNLKTMRWDSPDPKTNASWSPYAMMQGNPVMYNDVLGDTVRYKSFGDRFRVGVTRLFNKDFNADFKAKRDDNLNTFTYARENNNPRLKDATSSMNLLDAPVDGWGTLANQYDVKYDNWGLGVDIEKGIVTFGMKEERERNLLTTSEQNQMPTETMTTKYPIVPNTQVTVSGLEQPDRLVITNGNSRVIHDITLVNSNAPHYRNNQARVGGGELQFKSKFLFNSGIGGHLSITQTTDRYWPGHKNPIGNSVFTIRYFRKRTLNLNFFKK